MHALHMVGYVCSTISESHAFHVKLCSKRILANQSRTSKALIEEETTKSVFTLISYFLRGR